MQFKWANRLLFSLIFLASISFAQTGFKYKTLKDTNFKVGDKIITPAILFRLSGESYEYPPFLDSVNVIADFLRKHPSLKIELGGHTDSRGKNESNAWLSRARMDYVKNYLVKLQKIDSTRITIKGYGSTIPLIPDKTINAKKTQAEKEELHQKNRRTEIKILSTS